MSPGNRFAAFKKPESIEEARKMARIRAVDAAALWGLTPMALRGRCLRGEIPEAVKVGEIWFVTPKGMDAYFEQPKKKSRRHRAFF